MVQKRTAKNSGDIDASRSTTTRHSWAVDTLEESTASVEHDGGRVFNVPRSLLPADAREGDILDVRITTSSDTGRDVVTVTVRIDRVATKAATSASARQVKRAPRGNDPGGDIRL